MAGEEEKQRRLMPLYAVPEDDPWPSMCGLLRPRGIIIPHSPTGRWVFKRHGSARKQERVEVLNMPSVPVDWRKGFRDIEERLLSVAPPRANAYVESNLSIDSIKSISFCEIPPYEPREVEQELAIIERSIAERSV